jgi:hypothetical protein
MNGQLCMHLYVLIMALGYIIHTVTVCNGLKEPARQLPTLSKYGLQKSNVIVTFNGFLV